MAWLIDWRLVACVAAWALVVAAVAWRGRRVDTLPRCGRRRCRYDLSALLGAQRPGLGYPVTCVECGRVMVDEHDVRWGRRKARRWLLVPSLVVLLACAGVGGLEVYARATNTNPLVWMPLWMLIERAEHDSREYGFATRTELLRRAECDEITGRGAVRLLERILAWQQDETVEWELLGDVFATIAVNGHASQSQVDRFWAAIWSTKVTTRDSVDEGDVLPISIKQIYRGPGEKWLSRELPLRGPPNWAMYTDNWHTAHALRTSRTSLEVVCNDTVASMQRFVDDGEPFTRKNDLGPIQVAYAGLEANPRGVGQALVLFHDARAGEHLRLIVRGTVASIFPVPDSTLSWRHARPLGRSNHYGPSISEWPFEHVQNVEVLPRGSAMPRMHDISLESWIKASLKATYYDWSKHASVHFTKAFEATDPPIGSAVAFQVVIRTPERDYPAGTFALRSDLAFEARRVGAEAGAVMKAISIEDAWLVLKGDPDASKSFPDVTFQWGGDEIVLPLIRYGTRHWGGVTP